MAMQLILCHVLDDRQQKHILSCPYQKLALFFFCTGDFFDLTHIKSQQKVDREKSRKVASQAGLMEKEQKATLLWITFCLENHIETHIRTGP